MRIVLALGCAGLLMLGCKETKVEIPSAPVKVDISKGRVQGIGGGGDTAPAKPGDTKTGKQ